MIVPVCPVADACVLARMSPNPNLGPAFCDILGAVFLMTHPIAHAISEAWSYGGSMFRLHTLLCDHNLLF